MDNILLTIEKNQPLLSKTEKLVADFICKEPEQSAMYTLAQISQFTGVGEASIIRFAKKIGLTGFQELKASLQQRFSDALTASSRYEKFYQSDEQGVAFVNSFIDLQTSYLAQLKSVISSQTFTLFCSKICEAKTLYLFEDGGASMSPGNTLEFWLTRFGINVKRTQSSGHRIFDVLVHHQKGDVFLGYYFSKDNPDLIKLLTYCKETEIPSLVITDYGGGRTSSLADEVLILERGPLELFHSMSIPVLMAESIALFVARLKGDDAYKNLRELDDVRKKYNA